MVKAKNMSYESLEKIGIWRRIILLILIVVPSILAAEIMFSILPAKGGVWLNLIITSLFAILFSWISIGFWSSIVGTLILFLRYDRFAITLKTSDDWNPSDDFRTALLFPVYNEDFSKVAEGIRTLIWSLRQKNLENYYDIFILSDSTNPDIWVSEEEAWLDLCHEENVFGKLFYRHRKYNLKRKSGNIADFCRRWGANYRYMVVFDADSLISGETLIKMVNAMEEYPEIGILQTPPKLILSRSLLARVQQFANHLYGPIFAAGLSYWQLGDAQYWGHNAIIKVQPFMQYCQLPILSGHLPLGGEILSHDFVESALMRRAGYKVWLAYELGGSYEQSPPNLIEELVRDRRWCQGNLQHSRLIFTRGFFPTHRALFLNGIMSYGSALLWFFFLLASSIQALSHIFIVPDYFPQGLSLFPDWPKHFPTWTLTLLSGTAGLLFLPKIMALFLVAIRGESKHFGGFLRLILSVSIEILISTFFAAVRMLFHSFFVMTILLGAKVGWNTQNRDAATSWKEALRFHCWGTVLGIFWGGLMYLFSPSFFIWLSPVIGGLVLSIPLSVWSSRMNLGDLALKMGLFLTPIDINQPKEVYQLKKNLQKSINTPKDFFPSLDSGFIRAAVIPRIFSLHRSMSYNRRKISSQKAIFLDKLIEKALIGGPKSLNAKEKRILLSDPQSMSNLHRQIWKLDGQYAFLWGIREGRYES